MEWNSPDCNPLADLAAMAKFMIEACQMCGGTRWEYQYINEYPYVKVIKCSYCNGTGKLKQYQDPDPIAETTSDE